MLCVEGLSGEFADGEVDGLCSKWVNVCWLVVVRVEQCGYLYT